ncbi:hydrogenase/urease maturation nickel metallochaperone HypA [Methanolobus profundi]|uniref:Hydrogenase maturation factor HypA n=1 Tax=Methanolobus profundi TaxID=487685 RepID=A0A1I4PSV5_9EURY|nr:hydrogenase/urease maturation nickel metallochaperone HypA [Methanolobus profundi]SFM30580.1 hydrogenase nickel incorporation protein HypA/HybF [Methanolobus profundi]
MHEYSLACEIMDNVVSISESNQAKSVNSITVGVGKLTHVNPDQLMFCLEALVSDNIAQGAEIILNEIYPDMECQCGFSDSGDKFCTRGDEVVDDIRAFLEVPCPECGKMMHASGGRELIIESIDIEQ